MVHNLSQHFVLPILLDLCRTNSVPLAHLLNLLRVSALLSIDLHLFNLLLLSVLGLNQSRSLLLSLLLILLSQSLQIVDFFLNLLLLCRVLLLLLLLNLEHPVLHDGLSDSAGLSPPRAIVSASNDVCEIECASYLSSRSELFFLLLT